MDALARYSVRPRLPIQCHNHTATLIMKANEPGAVDPRSHHEAVRMMGNEPRAIQMAMCVNEVHGTSLQPSSSLPFIPTLLKLGLTRPGGKRPFDCAIVDRNLPAGGIR